jgi:hypothetical protein
MADAKTIAADCLRQAAACIEVAERMSVEADRARMVELASGGWKWRRKPKRRPAQLPKPPSGVGYMTRCRAFRTAKNFPRGGIDEQLLLLFLLVAPIVTPIAPVCASNAHGGAWIANPGLGIRYDEDSPGNCDARCDRQAEKAKYASTRNQL